jgi:hypothetical protein
VTVSNGQNYVNADFGYAGKGDITGTVFYDWDEDGAQNLLINETGIADVEVCLYRDNDGDGQLDVPGDTLLLPCQNTDGDGHYTFADQLPGQYLVVETQPSGLANTTPNVRPVTLVVIGPSGSATDNDFGEIVHGRAGDFIWVDTDGDGVQDAGETIGLFGVPVRIVGVAVTGASVDITRTASITGHYMGENLLPGTYTATAPAVFGGYTRTSPGALSTTLTVTDTEDLTLDFGYVYPTGVAVQRFDVAAAMGQVVLSWEVVGDAPVGFLVWRAENAKGLEAVLRIVRPCRCGPSCR